MADQPAKQNNSDEIDLGQLFQMIGRGFNKIGIAFLRLFLYLKKNLFILGGLIILGVGIGYGLNQIVEKKMKIEVMVKPNMDSEDYLYSVVEEVNNKLKSKDTIFFNSIGAPYKKLSQIKVDVRPIEQKNDLKTDLAYLELLEKFKSDVQFSDIIRKELLKNSSLNHRITFTFRDEDQGHLFARKVMEYINSAGYYNGLVSTNTSNAIQRIKLNDSLINQIDHLIAEYTGSLKEKKDQSFNDRILLDNEEPIDLTGLLSLKNALIDNTERKNMQLKEQSQVINIVNFGKPQQVKKAFFAKSIVLIPSLLLLIFFGITVLSMINKRAMNLTKN